MSKKNVIVLKVRRDQAGTVLPFDKLYFFKREDRNLIPKFFDYAIVLPIDEDLIKQIMQLTPRDVSRHKFVRDDDALNIDTGMDRRKKNAASDIREWWTKEFFERHDMDDRVAVVPVLVSKRRKRRLPRYLTATRWFRQQKKPSLRGAPQAPAQYKQGIHELAYLSTPLDAPHDVIQPICNICPRQLLQLNGECTPGMMVCYKSLDLNQILSEDEKEQIADAGVQ